MIYCTFLESDGGQFIDTGIYPTEKTRIVVDAQILSADLGALYGARSGYQTDGFGLFSSENYLQADYGTATGNVMVSGTGRHLFDHCLNTLFVDDTAVHTFPESDFYCPYPMALLSINSGGSMMTAYPVSALLYSAQIYDDGTLVRDFVPMIDEESGTAGLYDRVTRRFFQNAGTGDFIPGPITMRRFSIMHFSPVEGDVYARVYTVNPQGMMQSELSAAGSSGEGIGKVHAGA